MKLLLDDNQLHLRFAPLTLTKPLAELRWGILTNTERWKFWLPEAEIFFGTEDYLTKKYPSTSSADRVINAAIVPTEEIAGAIVAMGENQELRTGDTWIARTGNGSEKLQFTGQEPLQLKQRWDLYKKNDEVLVADFFMLTAGRTSQILSDTNTIIGEPSLIFLEEGATVEAAVLNTTGGPIYIGKDAEIMEGCLVRGPFSLGEHAALKMGAKIYGATTVGPHCKIGGEVSNSIFSGYSNKGHDGFLGNSVVGEWCNFGADSNTSNLKNNYSFVRTYSYESKKEVETGEQFMGLVMGDHSKCGINTMFNTASVIGVSCNVFGSGFPPKYIPSFSWGGNESLTPFEFEKAIEASNAMMNRRGLSLSEAEVEILRQISAVK